MRKLIKRTMASVAAAALCVTMAFSASAATASDVVNAAKGYCVPQKNVAELNNYLTSTSKQYTSADYDYMIEQMRLAYEANVKPTLDAKFPGVDPSTLTEAQLEELYKAVPRANKQAILDALQAVGNKYGVTIDATALANGKYSVVAKDPSGNVVAGTTTGNSALNTGDGSIALEVSAAVVLALAAFGTVAVSKKTKKSVM